MREIDACAFARWIALNCAILNRRGLKRFLILRRWQPSCRLQEFESIVHNPRGQAYGIDLTIIRRPQNDPNFPAEYFEAAAEEASEVRELRRALCHCEVVVGTSFGISRAVTQSSNSTSTRTAAHDARRFFHRPRYFPQPRIDKFAKSRRKLCMVLRFWIRASGIFHAASLLRGFLKSDNPAASFIEGLLTPVILGPGVLLR
jgi:hypothetical protein